MLMQMMTMQAAEAERRSAEADRRLDEERRMQALEAERRSAEADRRLDEERRMHAEANQRAKHEADLRFAALASSIQARDEADARADEARAEATEARELAVETVKNAVPLPKLESVRSADPSLRCGEWITRITLAIRGFSPTAGTWFSHVLEEAEDAYRRWTVALPLERSTISVEVESWPKYEQLSCKVSSLMLDAVSADIMKSAIQDNDLEPAALLFRVLKVYQPGGTEERQKLLAELSITKAKTTAGAAVEELRAWERRKKRAVELKLTLPDPHIQWASVLRVVEKVVDPDPAMSYRMMGARQLALVDTLPCDEGVTSMVRLYISELSQRALLDDVRTQPPRTAAISSGPAGAAVVTAQGGKKGDKGGGKGSKKGGKDPAGAAVVETLPRIFLADTT
jgi:hypothetical protein